MSELREDIEAIKTFGLLKVLYWRLIYRHRMRLIHRRDGHQMKALHPMGGEPFSRCDWCGHIELFAMSGYLRRTPSTPDTLGEREQ